MLSGRPVTYDAVGNRLTGPAYPKAGTFLQSYTYDYENRSATRQVTGNPNADTVTFKYDPFGRRIEKNVSTYENGNATTYKYTYVYDNEDIILKVLERTQNGNTTTTTTAYTHGPGIDEPLSLTRDGQSYYYHADGLGSVTSITDSAQAVVNRYAYDSFGALKSDETIRNAYAYTGRDYDSETGLYYYRARYYDPEAGRFISKDPIGFAGGGDVNLFNYVRGNPVNLVDPSGLLSSAEALSHYFGGSGTALDMNFSEVDTSNVKPIQLIKVLSEIRNGGGNRTVYIDDTFAFGTSGDAALFLGNIRLRIQGELTISNNCWSFEGKLMALPDLYDFNRSTHRTRAGELSTTIGRHLPGKPYKINILGEKRINQSGKIHY